MAALIEIIDGQHIQPAIDLYCEWVQDYDDPQSLTRGFQDNIDRGQVIGAFVDDTLVGFGGYVFLGQWDEVSLYVDRTHSAVNNYPHARKITEAEVIHEAKKLDIDVSEIQVDYFERPELDNVLFNHNEMWLNDLYVAPQFRRRGIGGQLVDARLALSAYSNFAFAECSDESIGLYEKRGFVKWLSRFPTWGEASKSTFMIKKLR